MLRCEPFGVPRPDEHPSASTRDEWGHAAIASWAAAPTAKHSLIALPRYARRRSKEFGRACEPRAFVRAGQVGRTGERRSAAYLRALYV